VKFRLGLLKIRGKGACNSRFDYSELFNYLIYLWSLEYIYVIYEMRRGMIYEIYVIFSDFI